MDKKELLETVNALAEQIGKAELDELEVETDEFRIRLSKRPPMPPMPPMGAAPAAYTTAYPTVSTEVKTQVTETVSASPKAASGKIIKSPIIGTFYAAAAPGKPPFVSVGSKVEKGGVVCIVESMKLMNEINSEYDGTVAEIYVNDGEAVEFDQPLFRIN